MTAYTETPDNIKDFDSFIISDVEKIKEVFLSSERILFYDACSFQRHSNLPDKEMDILAGYFKEHGMSVVITRCILMELASDRHRIAEDSIKYLRRMHHIGISIVIFDEEYSYEILSECFSTNEMVNAYLTWAVRTVKSPVSPIGTAYKANNKAVIDVIECKNQKQSDLYRRFFMAIRSTKEHGDDLGEELIAVSVHILSNLPGLSDGRICVLTDDKRAAGKIDSAMKRTHLNFRGAKVLIYSTPKLVQHMYQEGRTLSASEMTCLISQGTNGNVVVMGTTAFDFDVNAHISMSCIDLVKKIMEPNGINIVF